MTIRQRLDDDLKQAMRERDTLRLETVRNVRGTIRAREIDGGKELDEQEITKLIRGLVKQREESIAQYKEGGRSDLVERESAEQKILEAYLPAAASDEELERVVAAVIAETGASTIKDMGKVMKASLDRLGPAADGKRVGPIVKAKLGA